MATSPTSGPGGGGGGGFDPVSVFLTQETAINAHAGGNYDVKWDHAYDNDFDFNALATLPAGIGFTVARNGTDGEFTFTDDGLWLFCLAVFFPLTDATFAGHMGANQGGNMNVPMPLGSGVAMGTDVVAASSGLTTTYRVNTDVASLANPFEVFASLAISRIA